MTLNWQEEYLTLIEDCEKREERLDDWERGFIDSLEKQINNGKIPSQKQIEKLSDIWERVTKKG